MFARAWSNTVYCHLLGDSSCFLWPLIAALSIMVVDAILLNGNIVELSLLIVQSQSSEYYSITFEAQNKAESIYEFSECELPTLKMRITWF
jgi:hypothetical protein